MASSLRALRPSVTAQRLGGSALAPVELGQLLRAMASLQRPLLAFRLPIESIGSSTAGLLRAARRRQAAAALILDFADVPARALAPTLAAVGAAADEAGFGLPLLLAAEVAPLSFGDAERAAALVGEVLDAGFPTPVISMDGPAELALADDLLAASAPAREHGLGWALALGSDPGDDLVPLLESLAARGAAPAAVRSSGWVAGATPRDPGGSRVWLVGNGHELPEQREQAAQAGVALVQISLEELRSARGERAEAFAYFAADAALSTWDVEQTGPRAEAALLAAWTE